MKRALPTRDHTFRAPGGRVAHLMADHAGQWRLEVWSARLAAPASAHRSTVVRNLHKLVHERNP